MRCKFDLHYLTNISHNYNILILFYTLVSLSFYNNSLKSLNKVSLSSKLYKFIISPIFNILFISSNTISVTIY